MQALWKVCYLHWWYLWCVQRSDSKHGLLRDQRHTKYKSWLPKYGFWSRQRQIRISLRQCFRSSGTFNLGEFHVWGPRTYSTSPVYGVSDDDLPPVQASYHLMNPSGLLLIVPDHFTRQQKLFHRVCMEVQDGDEQPLRYGIPGAVRANAPGRENCFSYLKSDETLRVRRGTPKFDHVNSTLCCVKCVKRAYFTGSVFSLLRMPRSIA